MLSKKKKNRQPAKPVQPPITHPPKKYVVGPDGHGSFKTKSHVPSAAHQALIAQIDVIREAFKPLGLSVLGIQFDGLYKAHANVRDSRGQISRIDVETPNQQLIDDKAWLKTVPKGRYDIETGQHCPYANFDGATTSRFSTKPTNKNTWTRISSTAQMDEETLDELAYMDDDEFEAIMTQFLKDERA